MDDDWEKIIDESPSPKAVPKVAVVADVNKWAGEDEEEDIKDSWEDELEEKKDEEKNELVQPSKPKKTLQQKLAEKEKLRLELEEKRRKEKEEEDMAHLTPEERVAEKLRLQKLQEEADTKTALDSLGLSPSSSSQANIDSFDPTTKEEFAEYAEAICRKVSQFRAKEEYVPFLDDLVRNLCAGLTSINIRKIKTTIDNLALEKQKMEKGDKPKKKAGAKIKGKLRIEADDDYAARTTTFNDYDDFDDFM